MRTFLAATIFVLGTAACSSDTPSDPTDPTDPIDPTNPTDPDDPPTPEEIALDNAQVAEILGAHVYGEFSLQLGAASISKGIVPEGFTAPVPDENLEYTASGQVGNMTYSLVYHCNDGTPQHVYVPCDGTAHHSHMKIQATGAQAIGAMAMDEIDRVVDWEIRDLLVQKARFRGPDKMTLHTVVNGDEPASYLVKFNAVYEQVRFMPDYVFPTYGTIDFMLNIERDRGDDHRVFDSTARITFGSSGVPTTLVLDGTTYTFDVKTGVVTNP
jgi:hypothetical protein